MDDSKRKQQEVVDKMEKKDPETVPQAAVIETTTIPTPPESPIIIKIEQPKQPIKQMKDKNSTENPALLAKHILCALLFIATFATVMTFLWHYLDPSGMLLSFNYVIFSRTLLLPTSLSPINNRKMCLLTRIY